MNKARAPIRDARQVMDDEQWITLHQQEINGVVEKISEGDLKHAALASRAWAMATPKHVFLRCIDAK